MTEPPRHMAAATTVEMVDVGGHVLRCATTGDGPHHITCLHGLVDTLEVWDATTPAFAAAATVVAIDQRGHGGSSAPQRPCTRRDMAADVIAVLDAGGAERTLLVAHSMGGVVAMATALAFPERVEGLVLIGTTSQCSPKIGSWYERIAAAGDQDGLDGLARAIYGADTSRPVAGEAPGIAAVTRMLGHLVDDPLTPELGALRCPALLLVGEQDPMGPKASQIIHDAVPDGLATLVTVPHAGHWLHLEHPDVVVSEVAAWRQALGR